MEKGYYSSRARVGVRVKNRTKARTEARTAAYTSSLATPLPHHQERDERDAAACSATQCLEGGSVTMSTRDLRVVQRKLHTALEKNRTLMDQVGGWVAGWLGGWVAGWLGGWVVGPVRKCHVMSCNYRTRELRVSLKSSPSP